MKKFPSNFQQNVGAEEKITANQKVEKKNRIKKIETREKRIRIRNPIIFLTD